ncbi:penicillin-binding transpeptidase domain-containing protein [Microlunatus sp. Gsoil 973]|uniref:penicillin-binding transpeptidase domain-containing protein n=1 Tax=Microlunatus sp. Gsoil 973 TaxID=2672569 RepID=UPI0018A7EFDE|nr:penicillin-binding transpeptidase domain-containing protein [Microlunatus sp. Gsoil 973]
MTPEQNPTPASVRRQRRTGLVAGMLVAVVVTGCSGGIDLPGKPDTAGAAKAAERLAAALSAKDLSSLTFAGGATEAAKDFTSLTDPLGSSKLAAKVSGDPQVDGDKATSAITMSWRIPGATKPWTYQVTARFDRTGDSWQPVWAPSVVEPHLVDGAHLALSRQQADRGEILDDNGAALVKLRTVERVGIDKTKVPQSKAARSAAALAKVLDIDSANYVKLVKASGPSAFVPAIVFRKGDPQLPRESRITAIDGAVVLEGEAMLGPTKSFAAPILGTVGEATAEIVDKSGGTIAPGDQTGLSGLEFRYDKRLSGTPDISVSVVPPKSSSSAPATSPAASPSAGASPSITHTTRVFHQPAVAGKDLKISLDRELQGAAEEILADSRPASALVAIRPSTGEIVAAAVNDAADNQNLATYGQYPPGSTFKIIDSLALLRKGVKPDQQMACPATITVDGRRFKNYNDYPSSKLGDVDFRTAFANSCNTAFIGQRRAVDSDDLNAAAASLGFGTDYDVGFPAYFGSIPKPESETERAAEMIGQGRVLGSPMALATVVASVQAGHTVIPHLVNGVMAEPKGEPLTAAEAKQLRSLMHSVVTEGSGAALQSLQPPSVIAKTGTAEYGTDTPPKTHAWMVAARDDLAVAVFVNDGDSGSGVAGPLLKRFLLQG